MSNKSIYGLGQRTLQGCSIIAVVAALAACGTPGDGSSSSSGAGNSNSTSSSSSSGVAVDKTPITHQDNVWASTSTWHVNKWWQGNVQKEIDDGFTAAEKIINYNTGVWMDRIGAIEDISDGEIPDLQDPDFRNIPAQGPNEGYGLRQHLEAAEEQGNALFHFVVYDLPGRDCSALASNGELPPSALGMDIYQEHYVDRIAGILAEFPHIPVAAIIEIDSLPNLVTNSETADCIKVNNDTSWGYTNGVRYAVNTLSKMPNVHIYIDAGHSGWLGWDDDLTLGTLFMYGVLEGFDGLSSKAQTIGDEIESGDGGTGKYTNIGTTFVEPPRHGDTAPPGMGAIDGFITNTANYTPLEEPYLGDPGSGTDDLLTATFYDWNPRFGELEYSKDWVDALGDHGADVGHIGMLIDTGRNGWGSDERPSGGSTDDPSEVDSHKIDLREHRGSWCNQVNAGVGEVPQADPESHVDAYVWTKPQGESDGISYPDFTPDPNDPNKKHDEMCAPGGVQHFAKDAGQDAATTAMGDAPHAGRWFSQQFRDLVNNAYPKL